VAKEPPIHSRLLAMINAGRYHGLELDPGEFRGVPGDAVPSAASLSSWAQSAGMWSRAVRLRWRQTQRLRKDASHVLVEDIVNRRRWTFDRREDGQTNPRTTMPFMFSC
jgi:hypothetical protein